MFYLHFLYTFFWSVHICKFMYYFSYNKTESNGMKNRQLTPFRLQVSGFVFVPFYRILLGWRWRDSNSRPNEELICFLHVYLRLHCRGRASPKPPTHPLSSKVSPETRGLSQTISDIAAPPDRNASEPQHPGDVTSPQLLQGLSLNLLYFD